MLATPLHLCYTFPVRRYSMRIKTINSLVILFAFIFPLLTTGCKSNDDAIEYRNNEVSYADGESCVERYLLYEEDDTYERYIGGMYFGKEVPGMLFGTRFETGRYEVDKNKASQNITFYPKKQYDFDTKQLEYLGLENQLPYSGTLTEKTLTIMWEVWKSPFEKAEVPIVYKRD